MDIVDVMGYTSLSILSIPDAQNDKTSYCSIMTGERIDNELEARNAYQRLCFDQMRSPEEMLETIDALRCFIDAHDAKVLLINFHYPPESESAILERLQEREKTAQTRIAIRDAKEIYESLEPNDPALPGKIQRLRKLLASVDCPLQYVSETEKSEEQIDAELRAMESASAHSVGRSR